jgi:hypothetical protein
MFVKWQLALLIADTNRMQMNFLILKRFLKKNKQVRIGFKCMDNGSIKAASEKPNALASVCPNVHDKESFMVINMFPVKPAQGRIEE